MGLQIKHNGNILEVDLDVIKNNLTHFRSKLKKRTKLMIIIQSSCYDGVEIDIAELVEDMQIEYIAVTSVRDGCAMRAHGIKTPIAVLHVECCTEHFKKMVSERLEPVVYSLTMLYKIVAFVKESPHHLNIHLKIETGAKSKGIAENDIDTVINVLSSCSDFVSVKSIFSELANEVSPYDDEQTIEQASCFIRAACRVERELNISTLKHLVGDVGIACLPAFHYDMVRLGVGLLGVGIDQNHIEGIEEAITFKSTVTQLRSLPQGSVIPGEQKTVAPRDMDVAIVKVGYGDGFRRCLGEGAGTVLVNRYLASTVGKVCRDTIVIDVTGMLVDVDDEVIVFGQMLSVGTVAHAAGTIPEEILCGINERVKRVCYTTFDV